MSVREFSTALPPKGIHILKSKGVSIISSQQEQISSSLIPIGFEILFFWALAPQADPSNPGKKYSRCRF